MPEIQVEYLANQARVLRDVQTRSNGARTTGCTHDRRSKYLPEPCSG